MTNINTQNAQVIYDLIGGSPHAKHLSRKWAEGAILALWRRQTASEQKAHTTGASNGVGFSPIDAPIMSQWAEQLKYRSLTDTQLADAYRRLPKYANQIARYMKGA